MSRWPGRLITKTPVAPSGSSAFDSAPGVWTIPEVAYWTRQGLWPNAANVGDPYFKYVSFLLSTTATNAAQNNTFVDGSTNNFTITRNGNATQGAFSPYGARWSNYFDGNGDFLSVPNNAAFSYGTSDFTMEAWVYKGGSGSMAVVDSYTAGSGGTFGFLVNDTQVVGYQTNVLAYTFTYTVPLNAWTHIAFARTGGNLTCYINGTSIGSQANSVNFTSSNAIIIGRNAGSGGDQWLGYISNLRIVKGTAVYTSNFTPPTAPLTAITNTSLLTCQSNRFRDASVNNFAITANGNARVAAFNPFGQQSPGYSASTYGGSAYFDGNGDFLSLAGSSAFSIATSSTPFTIECWIYPTAAGGCIFSEQWTGGGNVAISLLMADVTGTETNGQYISLGYYNGAWGTVKANTQVPLNAWTHVAAVFNGAASKIFYNGVDVTAASPVTSWATAGTNGDGWYIGKRWDTPSGYVSFFSGHISGFRFVNGTAVYTSAFTPPTAPPTAVTNTSLLCNFTNAGIYDASMNCDMETAGNAQVSSVQVKYGPTSSYFDGNGDYLITPVNPLFAFGTGDFTVEAWVYLNAVTSTYTKGIVGTYAYAGATDRGWLLGVTSTGITQIFMGGSAGSGFAVNGATTLSTGRWYHLAATRSGSTVRVFVDGVLDGSGTSAYNEDYMGRGLKIGTLEADSLSPSLGNSGCSINGYIDDVRITKGYARYTTNFTPPSSAFFQF